MAVLHEHEKPVNDGERAVLARLRDELPADWHVISNFWVEQGKRQFECDALVVSPDGWAYLVETKAWKGRIHGNNKEWALPALAAEGAVSYRSNPVNQTHRNAQIVKDILRGEDAALSRVFVAPLVVIVSTDPPVLDGSCAEKVVLIEELIDRVATDPRTDGTPAVPVDAGARIAAVLERTTRNISPESVLGPWSLEELIDQGDNWELWRARATLGGAHSPDVRLKRYRLDSLAMGEAAILQRQRARRSLEALERLGGTEGALPLLGPPLEIEDSFVVVTAWPQGESLGSLAESGQLDEAAAGDVFDALVRAVASIHAANIVHRNITPDCAHFLANGQVVLTDFDYARLPEAVGKATTIISSGLDPDFAAPEVANDPANASKASDTWSVAQVGMRLFESAVGAETTNEALDAVPQRLQHIFRQALLTDPTARTADAEIMLTQLSGRPSPNFLYAGFETYDEIDGRYVVLPDPVGEGGIARVYHVDDMLHRRQYAAKFVKHEVADRVAADDEFLLLQNLPEHPCIVRPELLQRAQSLRRGDEVYELNAIFMLSEWIDGTRLDRLLEAERIPRARAVEIALAVAEALVHLQAHDLVHRDVKPQNIIIDREGRPRLVDFNVGRTLTGANMTIVGTPGYRPPDAPMQWGADSDPFALCVTLAEMLAGKLLAGSVDAWLSTQHRLPTELIELLQRGTAVAKDTRFANAVELTRALREALVVLRRPPEFTSETEFPTASSEEVDRPNWNPYQRRLLTLFSQSSETNRGTRGLDDFDRWAYVPTKVDRELYTDIGAGRFKLVVITGNAGDGKTAFVQMLQQRLLDDGATVEPQDTENRAIIHYDGRRLVTNLDGSQDEGERSNDDVLASFFGPFAGALPDPPDGVTHVIAINEGRLIDFVATQRERFGALESAVMGFVGETDFELPDWLLLVNLNLRALTAPGLTSDGHDQDSLTQEVLKRFADERIWNACAGCVAFDHCYARSNAATLRDPVLGPRTAERIRQTLDLVRLRRRMHITMRDLRSALAYIVAGTRTCDEIVGIAEEAEAPGNARTLLTGQMYNAIFAASTKLPSPLRDDAASRDRLLRATAAVDVAKTANPGDDARLWLDESHPFRPDPDGLTRTDQALIEQLRHDLPTDPNALNSQDGRTAIAFVQASLRRKLYLEREEPTWVLMLPYARLADFQRQLVAVDTTDRHSVISAISNSEGLFEPRFSDQLAVRLVTDLTGTDRSFVPHPADDFELSPLDRSEVARYVEYEPDSIRLAHRHHNGIVLDIDLDLYETLMRIRDGHTPSREELRGSWLNLRVFKERLASLPAPTLLLSRGGISFHVVTRSQTGGVTVEAVV